MTDAAPDAVAPDAPDNTGTASVFRLIYRSHSRIPERTRKSQLGPLFSEARSNNKGKNVTGALLIFGDSFVQTLEGDEAVVQALYNRIERDTRHDHVAVLEAETVDERVFPRWSMAEIGTDESQADTYLIAHQDGIAAATSRGSTPEQEAVLARMRQAARGDAVVN